MGSSVLSSDSLMASLTPGPVYLFSGFRNHSQYGKLAREVSLAPNNVI